MKISNIGTYKYQKNFQKFFKKKKTAVFYSKKICNPQIFKKTAVLAQCQIKNSVFKKIPIIKNTP